MILLLLYLVLYEVDPYPPDCLGAAILTPGRFKCINTSQVSPADDRIRIVIIRFETGYVCISSDMMTSFSSKEHHRTCISLRPEDAVGSSRSG